MGISTYVNRGAPLRTSHINIYIYMCDAVFPLRVTHSTQLYMACGCNINENDSRATSHVFSERVVYWQFSTPFTSFPPIQYIWVRHKCTTHTPSHFQQRNEYDVIFTQTFICVCIFVKDRRHTYNRHYIYMIDIELNIVWV